ncbi:MAG TPA: hypothetical protein VK689_08470 [Armatimonadota bacterium]|nr:hypothetical protein [Armatimonadota bacterium]
MFGSLLAGVATSFGSKALQKVAKKVATKLTASAAGPVIEEFLDEKLTKRGREKLGEQLVAAGQALLADDSEEAAEIGAKIIEGIKF